MWCSFGDASSPPLVLGRMAARSVTKQRWLLPHFALSLPVFATELRWPVAMSDSKVFLGNVPCNMIQCKVKRQPPGSCTNAMPLCPGGCIPNHVDEDVLKEVRNGFTFAICNWQTSKLKTMSCRNVRSRVPSRNFSTCRRDTVVTRRNSGWSELKRVDVSATVSLQDQVGTDRGWAFVTYEVRV